MKVYTLKVVDIIRETEDTVTLCFKQPGLKKISYLPGQYLTLIFRINGRRYIRPYSFSSTPGVEETLNVTVKRVPGGIVSNHINDLVHVGDSVEAMQPMGDFTYKKESALKFTSVVLWGAGSGITPLISIAKHVLVNDPTKRVHLIFGNRNHESVIFKSKIEQLEQDYKAQFVVWHFHTRLAVDLHNPYLVQGRIDAEKVISVMHVQDMASSLHYICGPTGLKDSVRDVLNRKGVPADHIMAEDFELVRDPKDFDDIFTQQIGIEFNGALATIEVSKGKSILEAGLDASLELPYSCQTGSCITCKGRLISGQLKMIGVSKMPEGIEQDEYLLCCSHPMTDDVQILVEY